MQEKRKKFWIIFSIVVVSIVSICFIFGMVTKLNAVNIEFRQRLSSGSRLEENIIEKVKADAEFEYNQSLLFLNIDENISKIEKKNPYVKVEQVVRDFPNNMNIYISERTPVFYIEKSGYYFVLDKEFKILDKILIDEEGTDYLKQNFLRNVYEINSDLEIEQLNAGDFIEKNENLKLHKNIYLGIVGALESVSNVKSVKISGEDVLITMKQDNLSFDDGVKIKIKGTDELIEKTFTAIEFFEKIDKTKNTQVIEVEKIEGTNRYRAYIINE